MDVDALFDKLAGDLAGAGATTARGPGGERVLECGGAPFARLTGERMSFRLPADQPASADAHAMTSSDPGPEPGWVEVPADDVSRWPILAQQALLALRG